MSEEKACRSFAEIGRDFRRYVSGGRDPFFAKIRKMTKKNYRTIDDGIGRIIVSEVLENE